MTAIEDEARAALSDYRITHGMGVMPDPHRLARSLEVLIVEYKTMSESLEYYKSLPHVSVYTRLERERDEARAEVERLSVPPSDAETVLRDAANALEAPNPANRFKWAAPARSWLRHRAALEAAERVRSAAPSTTEQEGDRG